jgi:uncharacterized protein (TIGR00661 family)
MRIAYAVHGYGRGHAARSRAVLAELAARHEVLVLAGSDAVPLLSGFPLVQIPCMGFAYHGTRLSSARTLRENAGLLAALTCGGGPVAALEATLGRFRPDVVVSDSEPLSLRAAGRPGIPRIGLDHVGIIAWCRPRAPLADALRLGRDALAYRLLLGRPERVVVSSFFTAPARRRDVVLIPPVLRARVLAATGRDGGHLLVYLNQPRLLTPGVLSAIAGAGLPAVVYGPWDEHRAGSVHFKPIDEAGFVEDLASARAVLCTAGHQLAAEALYLGKPMLLCPEDSAEQRLNARELLRLGVARCVDRARLDAPALRGFLDGADAYRLALATVPRDGNARAVQVLEGAGRELAGVVRRPAPGTAPAFDPARRPVGVPGAAPVRRAAT